MANLTINGATNGAVTLTVPAATGSSYTATFPAVTGNVMLQSGSTAFTTGSIPFATTNGLLTQNNANLFWDNTNNRLGVGTASPTQRFESYAASGYAGVFNSASAAIGFNPASSAIIFGTGGLAAYAQGNIDAASLIFKLSGSQAMTLDASGNLGIGTTSPSTKLDVVGSINLGASYINLASPNGLNGDWVGGYNICYSSGIKNVALGASNGIYQQNSGTISFHTNTSQAAGTAVPERARIDSSGILNVCSAVATPAGGSTSARLVFGTTAGFGIYYGSGAPTVSAAQGSIYIRSDGSSTLTRLYVNTNGSTTWTNFTSAA